jgi:hypothetical protein
MTHGTSTTGERGMPTQWEILINIAQPADMFHPSSERALDRGDRNPAEVI